MGEVFAGRYELADPIGHGGVGAVWRAWDHRRRRYVAAKVLQQRDAHALLRFVREQAVRIDHPHVLAPASWAADDDKVLFTMDLVAGGSLVHLVNDYGPLPPAFVRTLLDQLLSGLAAVHDEGVIHRDIKPANILMEATGTGPPRLRLSDFGIAMRLGEPRLTETDYVVGTPGYLAPEQVLGSEPDFPADLFAVGLVALYLLQGAKPDARALVEHFVAHGTPSAPRGVPDPLWQVVASLLQPDPAARFRTATGARRALAAAAELLPAPGDDGPDEQIEIFDQLGPLPEGFGPRGPLGRAGRPAAGTPTGGGVHPAGGIHPAGGAHPTGGVPTDGGSGATADGASGPVPARPLVPPLPPLPPPRLPAPGAAEAVGPPSATPPVTPPVTPSITPPVTPSVTPSITPSALPDAVARQVPPPPAEAPDPTPPPQPSPPSTPSPSPSPDGMSDTGSFHLPPPQPRPEPAPVPQPTPPPPSSPLHLAHTYVPTAGVRTVHQAYGVAVGAPGAVLVPTAERPPVDRGPGRHGRRAARRPGPPARIAVPVLLLALVCYAVGFWALTRI
ncbi:MULTISPECIES: serine/threonine-protein kinase [unclassified Streptomyces]|uniref:serine/threonine-protein kinase n=1 Tax=unclassified Streptomyces TaxID=2593676 RepID=UPI0004C06B90|nr:MULTISPECIES: serine/threonine-protein kinase [unclassified Streptomyces]